MGIGPEGGQSPPVPGKSVAVGLESGTVFITSAGGKRTRLTGGATIPVGSRIDTRKGRVEMTSAADRHGHQDADGPVLPGHLHGPPERVRRPTARPP